MGERKHILCTGGAGYIGSHTVTLLLSNGYDVTILDDFSNSSNKILGAIESLTEKKVSVINISIEDEETLMQLFSSQHFDGVIHFAAKKVLSESFSNPLLYYNCNVKGTLNILKAMQNSKCRTIVFSSTAAVYKEKETPISEEDEVLPLSVYGRSKYMIEQILMDLQKSDSTWSVCSLRYFNPIGAHPSGLLGERYEECTTLLPNLIVAAMKKKKFRIFGNDFDTRDGTGVRDYIHVMDLAKGHILALEHLFQSKNKSLVLNLGCETGFSVLEMLRAVKQVTNRDIEVEICSRRPGDLGSVIANCNLAKNILQWKPEYSIIAACESAWNFINTQKNS